jgi:molybdopterin-guanine dinucleotide biosynthesis protein A
VKKPKLVVAGAVLAGGAARRMGGVDKALLQVGGVTLLDRVLDAARPVCKSLVVVGPPRPVDVRFVQEAEPGGGPVPAVRAALDVLPPSDSVLVLATDLPLLTTAHVERLLAALDTDAAAAQGPNPLVAAYRRDALAVRAAGLGPGDRAAALLPSDVVVVDLGPATFNVNRPEDLEAAELLIDHDDHVVATAQWLRDLVTATVPDAVESVYRGWHGFGYRHPVAGYFCAVFPRAGTVQLSFEHGTLLPDPHGLLTGTGRQVRVVDVRGPGDPPPRLLVDLVDAAATLRDPGR